MIRVVESFLSPKLIDEILSDNARLKNDPSSWWTSHETWKADIIKTSAVVFARVLPREQAQQIYTSMLTRNLVGISNQFPKVMSYLWHPLSYIPWHNDGHHQASATIYLNEVWDLDWGGYFLWKEGGEIRTTPPVFNRLIVSSENVEHSTTLTTVDAPLRQTVQIFFK